MKRKKFDMFLHTFTGLTLVCRMSHTTWGTLDHKMHKALLTTLQDCYPARIARIFLVDPPWVIAAILTLARPFMKQKLQVCRAYGVNT